MKRSLARLTVVVVMVAGVVGSVIYANTLFPSQGYLFRYIYAGMILAGGVVLARELAILVAKELTRRLGDNALVASNAVAVIGYIVAAAAAASYLSFSPTTILASAAFGGAGTWSRPAADAGEFLCWHPDTPVGGDKARDTGEDS